MSNANIILDVNVLNFSIKRQLGKERNIYEVTVNKKTSQTKSLSNTENKKLRKYLSRKHKHNEAAVVLGWCKSNCSFALLNFAVWCWNTLLNVVMLYTILMYISRFMFFTNDLLLAVSVPFSPVAQSCPTLCDPMNHSMPGLPVHHQLPESTQTHVHWVGDAIQPSHPLLSPFPPAFNLSQHQGLFQWVSSSHQVAKVLEFQLQHQSCQWIFRTNLL